MKRPWWIRLLLSFGAGLASAVIVAVAISVVDIYLTGHGMTPLDSPLLEWPGAGIHLSLADVIFLAAASIAAAVTWRRTAGDPDARGRQAGKVRETEERKCD